MYVTTQFLLEATKTEVEARVAQQPAAQDLVISVIAAIHHRGARRRGRGGERVSLLSFSTLKLTSSSFHQNSSRLLLIRLHCALVSLKHISLQYRLFFSLVTSKTTPPACLRNSPKSSLLYFSPALNIGTPDPFPRVFLHFSTVCHTRIAT